MKTNGKGNDQAQGKAVIYARYSSSMQTEQSIEGQLREAHAYARAHGLEVVGEYIDRAISGTMDQRPDFQRMIAESARLKFDTVIVWKLDRFSRNRYDAAIYKNRLRQNGVRVVSATEAISEAPEGIILEGLLESMAEYYSANLSQNTIRGKRETLHKGLFNGGRPPMGYKVVDRKLVPDERTAPAVQYVFREYSKGTPRQAIIRELARRGYKSHQGRDLTFGSFGTILHNPVYIGKPCYSGIVVEGLAEPLIDEETFQKVQEVIASRRRGFGGYKARVDYILSGKAYCGICGAPMVGTQGRSANQNTYHYYKCSRRKFPYRCTKKPERKDEAELFVVEQTLRYVLDQNEADKIARAVVEGYERQFSDGGEKERLEADIARLDRDMDALVDSLISAPKVAHPKIYQRMEEIGKKKEGLLEERKQLGDLYRMPLTVEEVKEWLFRLGDGNVEDAEFRKHILDTFVNSVYFFDDRIVVFYNIRGQHPTPGKRKSPQDEPGGSEKFVQNFITCANQSPCEQNDAEAYQNQALQNWFVVVHGELGLVVRR